ncbi:MAG: permease-like cell division protein FtsX [Clostridia bacterium]
MKSIGYLFLEGIKNLWKNRTMSIASIAVLTSCLLLTGTAVLLTLNMDNAMQDLESKNTITVYLDENTPKLVSIQIGEELRNLDNISSCEYVAGEDALQDVMIGLGDDGSLFEGFDNFLPDAYKITITDITLYEETMANVIAVENVDSYSDYSNVATKLSELDELISYGSIAIIVILAIVALFIISNTLKVTMFSRRIEINIMKSVGATNLFIRIPFIVEGALIGALSGAVSATILYFAYDRVAAAVYNLVSFISIFEIKPYADFVYIAYISIGVCFGLMGGIISIGRYLKNEGENAVL